MKLLRLVTGAFCALGLVLAIGAGSARADCNADNAIYEDEFDFLDSSWGSPTDEINVEDGALVIHGNYGLVNLSTNAETADVCVDMTIVDAPVADSSPIGLVWWWQNWDNYYYLFYWADSDGLEIRRVVNGKSQSVAGVQTLALKKGVGQTNHLELQLRPKDATVFINGTQVARFKGKPPQGGAPVGVYALSPEDKPATFSYDNLVVSPLSE